jgi:hypothetical protein
VALADSCVLVPAQTVEGLADAFEANALPLTVTVTWSEALHPADVVAVSVNTVVVLRLTVAGSTTVASISEAAGVQLYVRPVPVTVAFRVVLVPKGIVWGDPASTTGNGFTVATTAVLEAG